jgi:non-canonical purine NTP pyrophosphatase (RdgB/HAM1 family)
VSKDILPLEIEPKNMFTFITTNEEKIETARRHLEPLGIGFILQNIELPELQSESQEEITVNKAKKAFEILKKPLIVTDHSWSIPALNGFPGPFMKYMNKWLTSEDFLSLMRGHDDKSIIKTETLCFTDGNIVKTIECALKGQFLPEKRGNGLSAMQVVSLLPSGKSVAECMQEGIDMAEDYTLWEEFGKWYKSLGTEK